MFPPNATVLAQAYQENLAIDAELGNLHSDFGFLIRDLPLEHKGCTLVYMVTLAKEKEVKLVLGRREFSIGGYPCDVPWHHKSDTVTRTYMDIANKLKAFKGKMPKTP